MDSTRGRAADVVSVALTESPSHQYSVNEQCDLFIHTRYFNHTGRTVRMGWRNGVIIDVIPRSDRINQTFSVRQELYMTDNLKGAVRNRLISHEGLQSEDFKRFKKHFMDCYQTQTSGITMKFEHVVTPEMLKEHDGSLYVSELDIILSTRQDNIPLHPFCLEALSRPVKHVRTITESGLGVVIVDNKEMIGSRFVRLMGKVVKIEPIKNSLKPDGIYLTFRGMVENARDDLQDMIDYIKPEEIEEAGWFFRSFAEAHNAPERDVELNYELKELDFQGKRLAAETSVTKSSHDIEKLELERINAELTRRNEEMERNHRIYEQELQRRFAREDHESKLEQLRSKDLYEHRSNTRKDTSEFVKFLPTLLMGAGAAFAVIRSLF